MVQLHLIPLFAAVVNLGVKAAPTPELGINFDKRADLPTITFSDATYRATGYDAINDVGLPSMYIVKRDLQVP